MSLLESRIYSDPTRVYPNLVVVTNSPLKTSLAIKRGLFVESDDHKRQVVSQAEDQFDQTNGNGVIVEYSKDKPPYPIMIVQAKLDGLRQKLDHRQEDRHHAVTDSVWMIDLGNTYIALNKPYGKSDREKKIIQTMMDSRGKPIFSNTAWGIWKPGDQATELFYVQCGLGVVNPDLRLDVLEKIVRSNRETSGGFGSLQALINEVIIPEEYVSLSAFRFDNPPYIHFANSCGTIIGGKYIHRRLLHEELSPDSVNSQSLRSWCLGFP